MDDHIEKPMSAKQMEKCFLNSPITRETMDPFFAWIQKDYLKLKKLMRVQAWVLVGSAVVMAICSIISLIDRPCSTCNMLDNMSDECMKNWTDVWSLKNTLEFHQNHVDRCKERLKELETE